MIPEYLRRFIQDCQEICSTIQRLGPAWNSGSFSFLEESFQHSFFGNQPRYPQGRCFGSWIGNLELHLICGFFESSLLDCAL